MKTQLIPKRTLKTQLLQLAFAPDYEDALVAGMVGQNRVKWNQMDHLQNSMHPSPLTDMASSRDRADMASSRDRAMHTSLAQEMMQAHQQSSRNPLFQ